LAQPSLLNADSLSPSQPQNDVQIKYVVDARNLSKKTLTIRAQMMGLQPGEVTLEFLNPKQNLSEVGNRISGLSLMTSNEVAKRIRVKRNRYRFDNSDETVEIFYQLQSGSISSLGKSTYLDEGRCLLTSSDAFLVPEDAHTAINVSFLLPEKWRVVTLAKPSSPESYQVPGRTGAFFYLGEAIGISERINNCTARLAVERDWPMSSRATLRETRGQIIYLQNLVGDWRPRAFLAVFLSPRIALGKADSISNRKEDAIFLIPPQSMSDETGEFGSLLFQLAEELVAYFLPMTRRSAELSLQSLTSYLAMKTCLKTGGMSETDFLEKMSLGLQEEPRSGSAVPNSERNRKSRESASNGRPLLDCFIVDLALTFAGKQSGVMVGAFQKSAPESRKTTVDWLNKLAGEESLAQVAAQLSSYTNSQQLADLLKPYGLILERIEIPHLSFELSETFQVDRIEQRFDDSVSNPQMGDRILAVNQNRLLEPVDLFKLRGSLRVGEDVTLTIERNGTTLRLKQRVERVSYCRLAVNGLADSDKQQKLGQFLAREVSN
jgi:Peptidase M61 N-terminal domain